MPRFPRTAAAFALAGAALLIASAPPARAAAGDLDFNTDIRPILSDRCFHCHGPDENDRKAGLRLDTAEGAFAELKGGTHAIKPGDPEASEALYRMATDDADDMMPPPESKLPRATPDEIALIRRWIEQGAKYEGHWAFQPVRRPEPPPVKGDAKIANDIDKFVAAHLDDQGLSLRPEAPRHRLIRRLSFDLTGIPPTPEEVAAFVNDPSPRAYEDLIDRLLKSPRYGERMAADWLDLARYADSYGYQVDRDRDVWPYRDWVIRAFNDNLPYDQFTTWQLAGDLLPAPTEDQVLATAFNRMHQQKVEGGSTEEEFRVEYVVDRVNTFGTAFLGLTLECARCHTHKFDPITQKEYYSLFSFFQNIDEAGLYSFFTPSVPTPTLTLPTDAQRGQIAAAEAKVAAEEQKLAEVAAAREGAYQAWLKAGAEPKADPAGMIGFFPFDARNGDQLENTAGDKKPATTNNNNSIAEGEGRGGGALVLTGDDAVNLPVGNFPRWQPFSVALWIKAPSKMERAVIFHRSRAWTDAASRGYELLLKDGRLAWSLIHFWPGNAISIRADEPVAPGEWTHVAATYDGSSRASGLRLYINGKPAAAAVDMDNLYKEITGGGGDNIAIGERFRDRGFKGGMVDEFAVFDRELTAPEAAALAGAEPGGDLRAFYLSAHDADYRQQLGALRAAREALCKVQGGLREMMVMREQAEPKPAYVLERGLYDARGEQVFAGTPAALLPFPEGAPRNRLGLAQWLTHPDHPLTSRTAVNRFWQGMFGRGLVGTANDFGSQGEIPVYRDLLNWLSAEFIASGWDVKALLKTIALSATYRQDSDAPRELYQNDPENRLLARGARFRLSAEMIRDNALSASGLLAEKLGGPSVKPYEIEESFKPAGRAKGEGLYRRSLYTYWRRTGPAPAMLTFDAAKRDVCAAKRERTASPLQALVLMNGPQFVEAARKLGERLLKAHGDDAPGAGERSLPTTPPPAIRTNANQRCSRSSTPNSSPISKPIPTPPPNSSRSATRLPTRASRPPNSPPPPCSPKPC
ncbi:MAG: DUF1549 domain-containing protein [Verrucomicrobiales bacterium]